MVKITRVIALQSSIQTSQEAWREYPRPCQDGDDANWKSNPWNEESTRASPWMDVSILWAVRYHVVKVTFKLINFVEITSLLFCEHVNLLLRLPKANCWTTLNGFLLVLLLKLPYVFSNFSELSTYISSTHSSKIAFQPPITYSC